jgi:polyhydroxyalkanoate synthesis repressor PhaR
MKTIKKYPNRKLYDTETSRYITLEEIAQYVKEGGEVKVIDAKTMEDITSVTMAQVLLGQEKRGRGGVPFQKLVMFLQSGQEFLQKTLASQVSTIRDEAQKRVQKIIASPTSEEIKEVVRSVDERLGVVVAGIKSIPGILSEIQKLRKELAELKARVDRIESKIEEKEKGETKPS